MLNIITTWKYFQRTGTERLRTTTGSFYWSGSGTQYLLKHILWIWVFVQDLRSATKNVQQCTPKAIQTRTGRAVVSSEHTVVPRHPSLIHPPTHDECWNRRVPNDEALSFAGWWWWPIPVLASMPSAETFFSCQKMWCVLKPTSTEMTV